MVLSVARATCDPIYSERDRVSFYRRAESGSPYIETAMEMYSNHSFPGRLFIELHRQCGDPEPGRRVALRLT